MLCRRNAGDQLFEPVEFGLPFVIARPHHSRLELLADAQALLHDIKAAVFKYAIEYPRPIQDGYGQRRIRS